MPTLGSTSFVADNPPFGAIFTYYLAEIPETAKAARQAAEKALRKDDASISFPGWEHLRAEAQEGTPQALLLVRTASGRAVRWLEGTAQKGLHRTNWDLTLPAPAPISLTEPAFKPPWAGDPSGPLAAPGRYTVELYLSHHGKLESQGPPQAFTLKPVPDGTSSTDFQAVADFQAQTSELMRQINLAGQNISEAGKRLRFLDAALKQTPRASAEHFAEAQRLKQKLADLRLQLWGDPIRQSFSESTLPSISGRVGQIAYGHWDTRQLPTQTHRDNFAIAEADFAQFSVELRSYLDAVSAYEATLEKAGAPATQGRRY
jgi:hypothetical protein